MKTRISLFLPAVLLLLFSFGSVEAGSVQYLSKDSGPQGETIEIAISGVDMSLTAVPQFLFRISDTETVSASYQAVGARSGTRINGNLRVPGSLSPGSYSLTVDVGGDKNIYSFSVLPGEVAAGGSDLPTKLPRTGIPTTKEAVLNTISTITDWIFGILLAISIIFLVWAAFQFVTGGPDGVKSGKDKLLWGAIGIALALIAFGIPQIIKSIVLD